MVFDRAIEKRLPVLLVTHEPADAQAAGGPVLQLGCPMEYTEVRQPQQSVDHLRDVTRLRWINH